LSLSFLSFGIKSAFSFLYFVSTIGPSLGKIFIPTLVRRPKDKGGLGAINISVHNDALLLKQLDKFYNKADIQWVLLIWQTPGSSLSFLSFGVQSAFSFLYFVSSIGPSLGKIFIPTLVRRPKDKGGLGVINISVHNDALLLKQLDKFYNKADIQWVRLIWRMYYNSVVPLLARQKGSFWWKDILRLKIQYRGIAICHPGKGDSIGFLEDLVNGKIHAGVYPNLFQIVVDSKALWKQRSSSTMLDCFKIPMTRSDYNEFLDLQNDFDSIFDTSEDEKDLWTFIWGLQRFSSHDYYLFQFHNVHPERSTVWIWETKCVPKIKFFGWLLLVDRLSTRNLYS
jgi:hypothetical protein